jgi:hypothetical protein
VLVPDGNREERPQRLLARLDALAAELARSGASTEATTRLLESAWTAVLHALTLDEIVARQAADRVAAGEPEPVPEAVADAPAGPEIPLAA